MPADFARRIVGQNGVLGNCRSVKIRQRSVRSVTKRVTGQGLIRSAIRVTTSLPRPTTSVLRCSWWLPQVVTQVVGWIPFTLINLLGDHLTTDHLH